MKRLFDIVFIRLGAHSKEERWLIIWQFIKFSLVGMSNTLISWACYYLVLWLREDLYIIGSLLGTIVSIFNAFYWNDRFVFTGRDQDKESKLKRLGKTYISYGGTSLLGMLLLWLEVDCFGLNKALAPPVNLVITIPLNYLINKFWTFGRD